MGRKATIGSSGNTRALLRATITPLASIFGSGFLVIVPILSGAAGPYAPVAMALVCGLAYCVGYVVRFNIRAAEPALANSPKESTLAFERCSDLALVLAYIVSVCLYLHILSAFVLGSLHLDKAYNEDVLTTAITLFIVVVGLTRGLTGLGRLESWALAITLVIIVALIGGFALYNLRAWQSPQGLTFFEAQSHSAWGRLTIIAGTLLVGFAAIMLAWMAETLELVALASRAFALYYLLQCLVAISVSGSRMQQLFFALVAAVLAFITVFAVPAG